MIIPHDLRPRKDIVQNAIKVNTTYLKSVGGITNQVIDENTGIIIAGGNDALLSNFPDVNCQITPLYILANTDIYTTINRYLFKIPKGERNPLNLQHVSEDTWIRARHFFIAKQGKKKLMYFIKSERLPKSNTDFGLATYMLENYINLLNEYHKGAF